MSKKESRTYSRRIRSSAITSVISISLVLLLLGLVGLLLINGRNIRKQVLENIGFNVILKENVKEADIKQLKKILDVMEDSGIRAKNIKMSGGGARSSIWQHIIADISGLKILIPHDLGEDLAVKGAAIIAGWGAGLFDSLEKGFEKLDSGFDPVFPDPGKADFYNKKFRGF